MEQVDLTQRLDSRPGLLPAGVTFFCGNDLQSVNTARGRRHTALLMVVIGLFVFFLIVSTWTSEPFASASASKSASKDVSVNFTGRLDHARH